MSIFKRLFGKKKSEESDGQEEFFKEDFAPVINRSPSTKHDTRYVEPLKESNEEEKKEVAANEAAKERERRPVHHAKKPERSSNSRVVKPVPVSERIIHPSSSRPKPDKPNPVVKQKVQESKPAVKKEVKASKPVAKAKISKPAANTELRDDSPELKGAVAVQEGRATPNGKFDIQRSRDGRYFFTLYASNHAPIAYSQLYSSSSGATTGINSIIANSQRAEIEDKTLKSPSSLPCPKWEIYLDKAQQYRFRLYAPNGQCVCHAAHGYSTKSGCKGGIESIKRFSAEAKVDKSYLK